MSVITAEPTEPSNSLTAPTVGEHVDTWGTILNTTTFVTLLAYILWLHERVPNEAVSTEGAEEGDVLTLQSGVWAPSAGGGGAEALDDLSDVDTSGASDNDLFGLQSGVWLAIANTSDFATATQGAKADTAVQGDGITNIVAKTQAEYDGLTPVAGVLYVITDA